MFSSSRLCFVPWFKSALAFRLALSTLRWRSSELCFSAFLPPSSGPPPLNGTNEQLSSAAIFEHVDRMSRAADASRRLPNKVQLIAMQPMPVPPLHSPPINGKLSDTNQINKEVCSSKILAWHIFFLANEWIWMFSSQRTVNWYW